MTNPLETAVEWLHHYSCTHHECCPCSGSEDDPSECDCGAIRLRTVLDALEEAQSVADAYEKHAWARLEDDKKRVNES